MNEIAQTHIRSISLAIEKIITDLVFIFDELKYDCKNTDKKNIHTIFTLKRKIININDRIFDIHTRINTLLLFKNNKHVSLPLQTSEFLSQGEVIDEIMKMEFHPQANKK